MKYMVVENYDHFENDVFNVYSNGECTRLEHT